MILDISVVLAYALAMLLLGWYGMRRARNQEEFLVAGRNLGPACYLDACRYANRRANDGPTSSRLLYEVFYGFFLPQFEGMDESKAAQLYKVVTSVLDPPEQAEAHRTIAEVLGVDMQL